MKDEKKAPKLRFKGFTDDWEQCKLGDVASFTNGRAYKQDELLDKGKYRVLRVGNLYTNDSWYYSNMELDDKYYINKGDLIYTWSATFGPHIWDGEKAIYHYHIWKVELSDYLDKKFATQLLESDKAKLLSNTNGSTMIHITKNGMENKQVILPSITEQSCIGKLLRNLDQTITLHEEKKRQLEHLKSALLQRMFADKSKDPSVRFKGFSDEWEQCKLGDISSSYSGGTPKAGTRKYYNGKIPFIRSGEISNDFTELTITEDGLSNSAAKMVGKGDILYALYGATSGEVSIARINGAINQAIMAIKPFEGYDSYLLASLLQNNKTKITEKYLQGGQGNLSATIVKNLKLKVPSSKEQKLIGILLLRLDRSITLYEHKLELFKRLKSSLLQNMFI